MIASRSKPVRPRILPAVQPADSSLGLATLAWTNLTPLLHRLARGEGLLLAVNLSIALFARPDAITFLAQALVSTAVVALLYCLNDVYDCRHDLNDAGKDQTFVNFCVHHRVRLFRVLALQKAGVVLLALVLLGLRSAVAVAAVFLVNLAYSAIFKGRAAIDVLWVALWGALYAMVPGVEIPLVVLALVGVMTSICHVFQITRDRPVDDVNRVHTSAVAARWLPTAQMAIACIAMGLILGYQLGPAAAASAATPLVLRLTMNSNQTAWLISKVYYGVMWLLVLGAVYGH